jgi:predicted transcriptional regulator
MWLPDLKDILSLRKKMGLTERELGSKCGISFAWIYQVEKGKIKDPSYTKLKKIADYYEIQKKNKGWTAGEICNKEMITTEIGHSLHKTNEKMISKGISQIPVFEKNVCVGMLTDKTIGSFFSLDKSKILINQKMLEPTPPIVDSSSPVKIVKDLLDFFDCVLVEKRGKIYAIIVMQDLNKSSEFKNKKK